MKKCTLKFLGVKKHYYFLALIIMLVIFMLPYSASAISNKINYSGRLLDSNGNAISRTVSMQFSIYSSSSGGSSLWTETKSVSVSNSYFSVTLGDTSSISLDFSGSDYYLGIKVGDDSEMTPRKYIGSTPYAINSDKIDGADAGTSANNVLKLNSSGGVDIAGKIKTTNDLDAGSSILDTLTVEGATSLQSTLSVSGTANFTGNLQLGGVTITSTASELNIMDGVTASTAEINVLDDGINFSELSGSATDAQIPDTITASSYLLLSGGTMTGAIAMGTNNITGVNHIGLNPISTGTETEGYIYYDSDTDAFYGRTAADWVNFAGDGGDITSVTAGNGLTGGGTSGDVTLDIAAGDTTITVAANSIVVGTIGSANITDGALTADDLATSSVATAEILNATIINEDISATAAIDATKIGGGAVSSTEFGYLDGVTSAIQTQFSNYLLLAGGTLVGDLAITTSDFDVTLGATDGASFTSNAAATADVLTITAATATDGVAGLYVEMSDNSTTGFINAIDVNLDVTTALLAAGRARGINVDVAGNAFDNASSSVMGIRLNGDATVTGGTLVGLNYNGTWDYGIYMNNGTVFNTAEIKLSGGGTALMGETIANTTDDMIDFGGVGGTDNTDIRLDLDGSMPVISSVTDSAIGFDDNISFVGAGTVSSGAGTALTVTANAASTWSTSAGALTLTGAAGGSMNIDPTTGFINLNPTNSVVMNFQALANLWIDAASVDNTYTNGVLRVDVDTSTTNNIGIALNYDPNGLVGNNTFTGQLISLSGATDIAGADTLYGLEINTGSAWGGNIIDAGIYITNGASDTLTNGLLIDSSGGEITVGVDVSDDDIVNALNVGANTITGTLGEISYTNFGINSGGSLAIDNVGNVGSVTVEGTILDINDLTFTGAGTVSSGAGTALTVTANAASTWSTSSGILTVQGDDGLSLNASNGNLAIDPGTQALFTLNPGSNVRINAANNTSTGGVLYLDIDTVTDNNVGFGMDYQPNGATSPNMDFTAINITIQPTSVGDDQVYGLFMGTTLAGDSAIDNFIYLNNSDDSIISAGIRITGPDLGGSYTDAIMIDGSGSFAITDAIDAKYANITNAINIGANNIEGTNFDVDGNGNITVAATQGLDTNGAGDLEIGATNATSISIGTEDTNKPVYLKGPIGGFSTWSGQVISAWTNGDPSTITVNVVGMDADDLVILTPVTRTVNAEGTLDYWVTSNAGSFTVSSSSSAGAFTETMDFNWIVIRQNE